MATSGSTDFSVNRDTLIKDALIDIGAVSSEDSVSDAVMAHAARLLNMMIKAWQADGLHLWILRPFTILIENGKRTYSLSSTGDHASLTMNSTAMKVAGVATDTSLDVDTTTGMTAADYICIELDDATLHETTIASITDSDTVVITDALPSAAAIDNRVYWYTTKIPRPLAIDSVRIKDSSSYERPVTIISRQEYYNLTNKITSGEIVQVYFDPKLTHAVLSVYNVPNFVDKTIEVIGYFPLEDMDAAANDFDFPQEWYLAIKTNLAVLLSPSYGSRPDSIKVLKALADEEKMRVMGWDKEKTSIYFGIDNRNN